MIASSFLSFLISSLVLGLVCRATKQGSYNPQESTLDSDTVLWTKAYLMPPHTIKDMTMQPIVIVVFRNITWFNEVKKTHKTCELGAESAIDMSLSERNWEDRSTFNVHKIICMFSSNQIETLLDKDRTSLPPIRVLNVSAEVIVANKGTKSSRLTLCIPTAFGPSSLRITTWLNSFILHYENNHDMDKIFIYSDDANYWHRLTSHFKNVSFKSEPALIHIGAQNSLSHYHSQRLAMIDCWIRNLHLGTEWILFIDTDEVLVWPYVDSTTGKPISWNSAFGNESAVTFPSWRTNLQAIVDDPINGSYEMCPEGKHQDGNEQRICGMRGCCQCALSYSGHRKFALSGKKGIFSGIVPEFIHEPVASRRYLNMVPGPKEVALPTIFNLNSRSGMRIHHFQKVRFMFNYNKRFNNFTIPFFLSSFDRRKKVPMESENARDFFKKYACRHHTVYHPQIKEMGV